MLNQRNDELTKACAELRAAGFDGAILCSMANVTYVTNVEVPVPAGALPELTYGPWLAVISARDVAGWAVVPHYAAMRIAESAPGFTAMPFDTFDSFAPTEPRVSYLEQTLLALTAAGLRSSRAAIAIESRAVPVMVKQLLDENVGSSGCGEAETAMKQARWIKTEREIGLLRRAAHLSDVAHIELATQCEEAGKNEITMWTALSEKVFLEAGHDIVLSGELVSGPRTATVQYPNGPRDRITEPGDAALMDLSGRADGYWFDCTNTHVIGSVEPDKEQRRYARASQAACEAAMDALRPGAKASDAAIAAERALSSFDLPMAHYAGHQIGVSVNEQPRLVSYDDSTIQAGMVFSVEPGAYQGPGGTFGARSEKMVLVKDSGPEILSTFGWGI